MTFVSALKSPCTSTTSNVQDLISWKKGPRGPFFMDQRRVFKILRNLWLITEIPVVHWRTTKINHPRWLILWAKQKSHFCFAGSEDDRMPLFRASLKYQTSYFRPDIQGNIRGRTLPCREKRWENAPQTCKMIRHNRLTELTTWMSVNSWLRTGSFHPHWGNGTPQIRVL